MAAQPEAAVHGYRHGPQQLHLSYAVRGANSLIETMYSRNLMVPVFTAGGNPNFDNLFANMPKITVEKKKLLQGSTPQKLNPRSVAVREDFLKRLKYLWEPQWAQNDIAAQGDRYDEFIRVSFYVAIILLHEFAHVVVRQAVIESPPNLRQAMKDYELKDHTGDAGTFIEQQLLSGRVIGMYKVQTTRLNDVSVPRLTVVCGIAALDIQRIEQQEMLQVVRDAVVPIQFTFAQFNPAPEEEHIAFHADEDEPQPAPLYVPAEGEVPEKVTCTNYDRPQQ
jgi:hypothetical protein